MAGAVVGIDLGTANSCVAVVEDGRAVVLSDGASRTVPSVVSFSDDKEIVGHNARRQAVTDPRNTVITVKRLMGHRFDSPEVSSSRARSPYAIEEGEGGAVVLAVGGRKLTPVDISTRVLRRVKEVAEGALRQPVSRAVIAVPAHFNDVQRKATKLAAEHAGLEVIRLINEPTAAAFAYGYRKGEDFTLAVYDLGGGTFDISVMTAKGDSFEVIATDGDSFLGGEDIDHSVAEWLRQQFEAEYGHDLKNDEIALLRLKEAAERAKVELSATPEARIDLPFLSQLPDGSRPDFATTINRDKLNELARPHVQKTLDMCRRCLEDAQLDVAAIDEVLLVGGQTRMPSLRESVKAFFKRDPRRDINPDEVVAMGAALYAYSLCADSLQEEAVEAAEDAYAIARRGTDVARKVVAGLNEIGGGAIQDLPELRERINALLAEAGDDDAPTPKSLFTLDAPDPNSQEGLPSRSGLPGRRESGDSDLPIALSELRGELSDLSEQAQSAIGRLAAEIEAEPASEGAGETVAQGIEVLSSELQSKMSERLEGAREKSVEATDHLEKAEQHKNARRVDLLDITSLSLGIVSAGDLFTVLIEHNTPVPAENQRVFTTNQDGQSEVHVRVRQGRAQKASQNQLLGEFVLEGIEPAPRMAPKIEVTFKIDENGILSVGARDQESGREQSIRVEDPLGLQQAKVEDLEKLEAARSAAQETGGA